MNPTTVVRLPAAAALLVLLAACGGAGSPQAVVREGPAAVADSVAVTLVTEPPGLRVVVDGRRVPTPHVITGPVGREHQVFAPTQFSGDRRLVFRHWNDGGAQDHPIALPGGPTTLVATFADGGAATGAPPRVTLQAPATGRAGVPIDLGATASAA